MKILVVDDEIPVATVLADALGRDGHDVIVALDAPEALSLLSQYRPDAVFLDVTLGELSGIDLLRQLRKTDRDLPVVLITGQASASQLNEARHLGVTDIIEKPFVLKRLTQCLRAASRAG